jgi:hypothetical protein
VGGQVGVLPVPARPAADPAVAADSGSKIYAQGVYFWAYMEVLKGVSSFKRPTTACLRGCGYRVQRPRQPTAGTAAPPRPGHSPWEYMQPALASASVEVAQTAGGCDSRRPGPGRRTPPVLTRHAPGWRPPPPPPGGGAAGRPAEKCRRHHHLPGLRSTGHTVAHFYKLASLLAALAPRDGNL